MIQAVYPSSKVAPETIAEYGWSFVEDIDTITNEQHRLAPTPERSQLHVELRSELDANGTAYYLTAEGGKVELRDFALADSPTTSQKIGFFALK